MIPNRFGRTVRLAFVAVCVLAAQAFFARLAHAQQSPPAGQSPSSSSSAPGSPAPPAASQPSGTEQYNLLPAEKDVEVATFYIRKGDPDAAISRLEEAIRLKPDYAKPRLMLAEIYEKKNEKDSALKYYREYLKVYPHAPDSKKVQEKIAKLAKQ